MNLLPFPSTIPGMIRLAFSTNAFKKHSITEAVNAIAGAGGELKLALWIWGEQMPTTGMVS